MSRVHVFADEAGNFDFRRSPGASEYFVLTTVAFFDDRQACRDLQELRFELAWEGTPHSGPFYATTDQQAIRDRVFAALASHSFRVDSTVFEKAKVEPRLRPTDQRFYQYAWFYHMKYVARQVAGPTDELLVIAASIGEKKKRDALHDSVVDIMKQVTPTPDTRTTHWPAAVDTGLQIADYCSWAIQRKWERGDDRSYRLIQSKIRSEFKIYRLGTVSYY